MRSKREMREGFKFMFAITDFLGSYFDSIGLAAARIDVLAFSWQTMPALATEIVCCYIASSRTVREL